MTKTDARRYDTPPTLGEALSTAVRALDSVSSVPALDAEVLLCHVLGRNRSFLRAWPEIRLTTEQALGYAALVEARQEGQPIAHLTGSREFWSREFLVTPDVLIPRPETELLIERALELRAGLRGATLLDLATGSGVLAVTLAAELPDATVYASDLSAAALEIARLNAERHRAERIRFVLSDWFAGLIEDVYFDLIVSNPPYVADADPHLTEGDVRFEPRLALTAGPDGFAAFRIIAAQAGRWLTPGGILLLEHGFEQGTGLRGLLEEGGFVQIMHHHDLQGHCRATEAVWPGERQTGPTVRRPT